MMNSSSESLVVKREELPSTMSTVAAFNHQERSEESMVMHTMSYICNCDFGSYLCFNDILVDVPSAAIESPPEHRSPERKVITSPPRSPGGKFITNSTWSGCASPPHGHRLTRKSSLKSPSTAASSPANSAPDTPRKSVRFADSLGLDLEIVRLILEHETTGDVPKDMVFLASKRDGDSPQVAVLPRYLSADFQQPSALLDFRTILEKQKVCLENAVAYDFTIIGTIKVRNITYEKVVKIRYSFDGWRTFGDAPASYVRGSCDGPTDRFSFGLPVPKDLPTGGAVEFCVCYTGGGRDYWDNRFGKNYRMECMTQADESTAGETHFWNHFV